MGAVCDSLGKTFLLLLVNNIGANGGLRMNSSQVKVKLINPLFLPKGNAILRITPKAVCDTWREVKMLQLIRFGGKGVFEEGELVHQLLNLLLRCLLNSPVYTGSVKYCRYFEHCNDKSSTNETSLLCWLQQITKNFKQIRQFNFLLLLIWKLVKLLHILYFMTQGQSVSELGKEI